MRLRTKWSGKRPACGRVYQRWPGRGSSTAAGAVTGSLAAGLLMSRACLADLGEVAYVPCSVAEVGGPAVQVTTDDPVRACLASQYAGWQVSAGAFFAMGSGPMRALAAREELFQHIRGKEESPFAVGRAGDAQAPDGKK